MSSSFKKLKKLVGENEELDPSTPPVDFSPPDYAENNDPLPPVMSFKFKSLVNKLRKK